MHPLRIALSTCFILIACDDRTATPSDGGPADAPADAPVDAPDGGPATCAEAIVDGLDVTLDGEGPDTQIHAATRFDGEGIWVVYNRPEAGDTGLFDVFATRLACDGGVLVEPFLVQEEPLGNDVDPDLAISGDRMIIAWQKDTGEGGIDNLEVHYRVFDLEGSPAMATERRLITTYEGEPVMRNHFNVRPAPIEGGFLLAGARGLEVTERFSAYVQRVDLEGELEGEAVAPDLLEGLGITQLETVAGVDDGGELIAAYDQSDDDGPTEARVWVGGEAEAALTPFGETRGADLWAPPGGPRWLTFTGNRVGETHVYLLDLDAPRELDRAAQMGALSRVDYAPRLAAAGADRGAVAHYRNISGLRNELWAVPFRIREGEAPALGDAVMVLGAPGAPPYQPAITHVADDAYFLAWSEGTSPAFRIHGRFVRLPAP